MTSRLSLTVLVDNTALTDRDFMGEPGLSFFIETAGKKILFDTGLSGLFFTNAEKMGIDLCDLDCLILSHGHSDHTGGLPVLARNLTGATEGKAPRRPCLVAHPRCFWPKAKDGEKNGSPMSEEEAGRQFPTSLSEKPVWITDDLVFLGEIPRRFAFEKGDPGKRTIHTPGGNTEPDYLVDDTALAFRSGTGLVIITGCSHAGICNITEYAREVCGENRVSDIIGGLHLLSPTPKQLAKTGKYLNRLHLDALHACHCTSLPAKLALAAYCPLQETGVGMRIEW
ncbi:MBL fold metallo-hydrolase [Methanoregula sp. UBA64]|jgi:7,8-dihydropterin-6-yl-methyl-4-(beta-D-ribofuranosyl)aminobenzene 5'-phosphate synthase|uniref:MBL fold metallo-hydrolase n=1 Tax=Methanoregula sp. UBA64 TaxID=1915554 RepID=UPI0025D3B410|nr:MBL fold metallo-hydrolase [Methanoregula sp. UBA64]